MAAVAAAASVDPVADVQVAARFAGPGDAIFELFSPATLICEFDMPLPSAIAAEGWGGSPALGTVGDSGGGDGVLVVAVPLPGDEPAPVDEGADELLAGIDSAIELSM